MRGIMGAICCCLRGESEDFGHTNSSMSQNLICVRFFVQNFLQYTSSFHGSEEQVIALSTQETTSLSSAESLVDSLSDMFHSPPRPLPYDADPRYSSLQQDGLVSRQEKGSSHAHETESLSTTKKWNEATRDQGSKECNLELSPMLSAVKTVMGFAHIYASSEDEDVCPTCLEEYTMENPKIITKCSHHYHLGCIYEWMERSDTCPVCGKVMAFDEAA